MAQMEKKDDDYSGMFLAALLIALIALFGILSGKAENRHHQTQYIVDSGGEFRIPFDDFKYFSVPGQCPMSVVLKRNQQEKRVTINPIDWKEEHPSVIMYCGSVPISETRALPERLGGCYQQFEEIWDKRKTRYNLYSAPSDNYMKMFLILID